MKVVLSVMEGQFAIRLRVIITCEQLNFCCILLQMVAFYVLFVVCCISMHTSFSIELHLHLFTFDDAG